MAIIFVELKIHFDDYGWAACGVKTQDNLTAVPRKVDCEACKRTKAYREMMR